MSKLLFAPRLIPTLFSIPTLIVLLALGTWQVHRLQWKSYLIETINNRVDEAAIFYAGQSLDIEQDEYRRFVIDGVYDHAHEKHLYMGPKVLKGKPGYNILTPLLLSDGKRVLVDRGWIVKDKKDPEQRPETLIGGHVRLEVMLHKGEKTTTFMPDNDVKDNLWFWVDVPTMLENQEVQPIYFRVLKTSGYKGPFIRGERKVHKRNDHLEYAITWYSLAIILVVIYVLYHLGLEREARKLTSARKKKVASKEPTGKKTHK